MIIFEIDALNLRLFGQPAEKFEGKKKRCFWHDWNQHSLDEPKFKTFTTELSLLPFTIGVSS